MWHVIVDSGNGVVTTLPAESRFHAARIFDRVCNLPGIAAASLEFSAGTVKVAVREWAA